MRNVIGILIVLGLTVVPAAAQKVVIDYAHDYDFSKVKKFEYVPSTDHVSSDPLMDGRIREAILKELKACGLEQVESEPDVFITYHISEKDEAVLSTIGMGYGGFGLGWAGWGGGIATTTEATFTEGTLIVDAYGPDDKKLVWRASGTVTLKSKPEKVTQQIDNIVAKMAKKWERILQGEEKGD